MTQTTAPRHFLDLSATGLDPLQRILAAAARFKAERGQPCERYRGKTLAMLFDQPSTRTRMSFDIAFSELGGRTQILQQEALQLGRGESIRDTAQVMSRYVHALMIRNRSHARLLEYARHAGVPVINAMTHQSHPCQTVADLFTIQERKRRIEGLKLAWIGDTGNVVRSLMQAAGLFGFDLTLAVPEAIHAQIKPGPGVTLTADPRAAARHADVVMTDAWRDEAAIDPDLQLTLQDFFRYQVNAELMALARPDAIFLHCMPVFRNREVTDEVMDSAQSAVIDGAENRLHTTKAILQFCLEP